MKRLLFHCLVGGGYPSIAMHQLPSSWTWNRRVLVSNPFVWFFLGSFMSSTSSKIKSRKLVVTNHLRKCHKKTHSCWKNVQSQPKTIITKSSSHTYSQIEPPPKNKHESLKIITNCHPLRLRFFTPPPFHFLAVGPIFRWLFVSGRGSIVWTQAATSQDSPTSLGLHKQQRTWAWDPRHLKKYEGGIGGHISYL